MRKLVSESLNQFLNEAIDMNKAGELIQKLLKDYKFHMFYVKGDEGSHEAKQKHYAEIKQVYEKSNGTLPNNLQGVAVVWVRDKKYGEVELFSMEKTLIKQMMDKIDENYSTFSDSENKKIGVEDKTSWGDEQANKGSKGSEAVQKDNIRPDTSLTWKNKEGEQQAVYKGKILLF